ncbi:hypothetical protein RB653_004478 [Dictyostelium firmibasis]|uniref:MSP domain-containing protein n=1 Tax=Dictyostelium firmibasis TaxID=79012 RepID=A0AAN7YSE1_9MYCE
MSNNVTVASPSLNPKPSFLKIRPKELVYHPPFVGVITNELKLYNSSDEHTMAFKVKTTAPIRYCVRPNTGIIPPGKSIDVQILLNCTKDSPSISMKTKDKFQILSIVVTDPNIDPKSIWTNSPQNLITKNKLKAVFSLPSNEQQSPNISSSGSTNDYKSNSTLISEVNNINNTQKHDHHDHETNKSSNTNNIDSNSNTTNNGNNSASSTTNPNRTDSKSLKPEITKRNVQNTTSSSSSIQDTETEKLRNQLKNLNDELDNIKKGNITPTNITQTKGGFNHYQTLIVILAIAILSFVFGKLI